MSNDDIVKLLDLIKKRAVDILNRLDKTTVENPGSWPDLLGQYMVLATQYSNLQQELTTILNNYAIQPVISTKNNFSLNDIPQLLGTKMEPELEQEEKQLVESSGLLKDNNHEETLKELKQRIDHFNTMCDSLENHFFALLEKRKQPPVLSSITQIRDTISESTITFHRQSILDDFSKNRVLLAFDAAINEGEGFKNPPQTISVAHPTSQSSSVNTSTTSGIFVPLPLSSTTALPTTTATTSGGSTQPISIVTPSLYTSQTAPLALTGQSLQQQQQQQQQLGTVTVPVVHQPVSFTPFTLNASNIKKPGQWTQQLNLPIRQAQAPTSDKPSSAIVAQNTFPTQQQQPQPQQQTIITNVAGSLFPFGVKQVTTQTPLTQPSSSVILTNLAPNRPVSSFTTVQSTPPQPQPQPLPPTTSIPNVVLRGQPLPNPSTLIGNMKDSSQPLIIQTSLGTVFPPQLQLQLQLPQQQPQPPQQLQLQFPIVKK